jgi:hypothetical protein
MTRVKVGIIVAVTIAFLILAKGVGVVAFVLYKRLRRTVPA